MIRRVLALCLLLAVVPAPADAGPATVRIDLAEVVDDGAAPMRKGEAVVEGRLRRLALVDANADGRFDDPAHDLLLIDHYADEKLDSAASSPERTAVNEHVRIGETAYRVTIEDGGARLRLDPDRKLSGTALRARLPGMHPGVVEMLIKSEVPAERVQALSLLRRMRDPRALAIARTLVADSRISHEDRLRIVLVLSESGAREDADALMTLHQRIGLPRALRERIVRSLMDMRDKEAVKRGAALLASDSRRVRVVGARLLGALGDPKATRALVARGAVETDATVLEALLDAVAAQPTSEAAEFLIAAAKRGGPKRIMAVRALARIGFTVPVVRKFFGRVLGAKDIRERILALDLVAQSKDVGFCPRIAPSLEHRAWEVRQAAVEAMVRLRCIGSIDALVARLGREQRRRLRVEMGKALFDLTGVYFYEDAERWQSWWRDKRAGFQVPVDSRSLPDGEAGGTTSGFYGLPMDSDHVLFVIDKSGSMNSPAEEGSSTTRWEIAVREILRAVKGMPGKGAAGVLLFDNGVHAWRTRLARSTPTAKIDLERFLTRAKPSGGTNLFGAVQDAYGYTGADTIFIVSDGLPSAGRYRSSTSVLRAVRRLAAGRRIVVHTVSVGMASPLLEKLAAENRGRHVRR